MKELNEHLKDSLRELNEQMAALAPGQWEATAPEGGWTIAGIVEHLATVERGVTVRLRKLAGGEPAGAEALLATVGKEERIAASMPLRERVVEAPEPVRPNGRYGEWPGAWEALQEARAKTIAWLREEQAWLEAVVMPHQALGPLTGRQWMRFLAAHTERHVGQIRQILAETEKPRG